MIALVITLVIVGVGIPDPAEPTDGLATVDSISVTNRRWFNASIMSAFSVMASSTALAMFIY